MYEGQIVKISRYASDLNGHAAEIVKIDGHRIKVRLLSTSTEIDLLESEIEPINTIPSNINEKNVRLHLGCGERLLPPPWKNIDKDIRLEYAITMDATDLSKYEDDTVDEIYASHVLDHLSRNEELDRALSEWYRVLKPGGILRVAVSDFEKVVKMYNEGLDLERLWGHIVGGHKTKYDQHKSIFDFKLLRTYLEKHGFINVERYNWRDFLPNDFDDLSSCYIPHMDKENGILMSLNVQCMKVIMPKEELK